MFGQMTRARFASSAHTLRNARHPKKSSLATPDCLANTAPIATLANLYLLTLNAVVTCNTLARIGDDRDTLPESCGRF
jgi:hypothetical protein